MVFKLFVLLGEGKAAEFGRQKSGSSLVDAPASKKKHRSRKEKAEASNLRNIIATKEYELQRQEKMIQKKGTLGAAQKLAGSAGSTDPLSPAGSAQELMHVLNSLQCDIKDLKDSYYKLTGVSYESSSRRRFLSRMRGNKDKENAKTKNESSSRNHERFEAAYAAAAATSESSSPVSSRDMEKLTRERQILEARNQLSSFSEYDHYDPNEERPYPNVWKVAM